MGFKLALGVVLVAWRFVCMLWGIVGCISFVLVFECLLILAVDVCLFVLIVVLMIAYN